MLLLLVDRIMDKTVKLKPRPEFPFKGNNMLKVWHVFWTLTANNCVVQSVAVCQKHKMTSGQNPDIQT